MRQPIRTFNAKSKRRVPLTTALHWMRPSHNEIVHKKHNRRVGDQTSQLREHLPNWTPRMISHHRFLNTIDTVSLMSMIMSMVMVVIMIRILIPARTHTVIHPCHRHSTILNNNSNSSRLLTNHRQLPRSVVHTIMEKQARTMCLFKRCRMIKHHRQRDRRHQHTTHMHQLFLMIKHHQQRGHHHHYIIHNPQSVLLSRPRRHRMSSSNNSSSNNYNNNNNIPPLKLLLLQQYPLTIRQCQDCTNGALHTFNHLLRRTINTTRHLTILVRQDHTLNKTRQPLTIPMPPHRTTPVLQQLTTPVSPHRTTPVLQQLLTTTPPHRTTPVLQLLMTTMLRHPTITTPQRHTITTLHHPTINKVLITTLHHNSMTRILPSHMIKRPRAHTTKVRRRTTILLSHRMIEHMIIHRCMISNRDMDPNQVMGPKNLMKGNHTMVTGNMTDNRMMIGSTISLMTNHTMVKLHHSTTTDEKEMGITLLERRIWVRGRSHIHLMTVILNTRNHLTYHQIKKPRKTT
mmetsp:Transcript_29631/g.42017  ORF Transcript_29631/g.42017 Transcript_29631/m.42017 type:complete len:514 (+) Transcript_29631:1104-2645(+)